MKDLKPDENVAAPEMDTVTHREAITGSTAYLIEEAAGQISRLCNKYHTMRAKLEKLVEKITRCELTQPGDCSDEPMRIMSELNRILEDADDKEE